MSDIDLTEAVAAAARTYLEVRAEALASLPGSRLPSAMDLFIAREIVLEPLTAAAPLIEAQVREMVAQEIEARVPDAHPIPAYRDGLTYAAQIARGDA